MTLSRDLEIVSADVWMVSIPYRRAYGISQGTAQFGKHVVLKLTTKGGIVGLGEAALVIPERGNTQESIFSELQHYLVPAVLGMNALERESLWWRMDHISLGRHAFPFGKAAVDQALWDIAGRSAGLPVFRLLGGPVRDSIGVSRSLPTVPPAEMAEAATRLAADGYKMLTVKAGTEPEKDLAAVREVRAAIGPSFPLEVDPNQGYRADTAISVLGKMEHYDLQSVEQPCPWWDLDGMASVTAKLSVPIIADESVMNEVDTLEVARRRAAHIVCIRLTCAGGITIAAKIVAVAGAAGLGVSMASRHTFGVGTSAIHHFVAACPAVQEPIGYGSPLERFAADIIQQEIPFANGVARPIDAPGFGVDLDPAAMERYNVGHVHLASD